ncbi:MAG: hypothetical protein NWQ55_02565 [Salibacteraceae bacterium]|nr:hypothetical protein [Salibacteraceae bacterium]MDP4963926.1 hypothetical protein [Salibacteraceae bacterium]
MKKMITATFSMICIFISVGNLTAQNHSEAKTLFGNDSILSKKDIGFFIAPTFSQTQMDRSNASLFGVRGGVTIKDKVSVGAFFNTSINEIKPKSETLANVYMDYWAVGGFVEYTLFSKSIFHVTFPLFIGFGEVEMDNEMGDVGLGEANFFQIEPSALLEINLHKHVRLNLGAGYRFVESMNYRNFNQSDIVGLTGNLGLKFGLFK